MQGSKNNKIITNRRNRMHLGILFLCIAFLSVFAIVTFNKSFSITLFLSFLQSAHLGWMGLAIVSVFLFILFEGLSLRCIYRSLGYRDKIKDCFLYSAADIYFSAITPSASGGQPASAYFMLKKGIPLPIVTVSLLYTLLMYSVSIVFVFFLSFLFFPSLLYQFDFFAKVFVICGFLIQFVLIFCFYCLLYKEHFLYKICTFLLKILAKCHLVHYLDEKLKKLQEELITYQTSARLIKDKKKVLLQVFLYTLLQRICQIGVIVLVFLATKGTLKEAFSIFAIQCFVITGAYIVPIPGAIGVTDYLMLQGFEKIMPVEQAVNLELLSRGLSFYFCILLCGFVLVIQYFKLKRSSKK